MSSKVRIQTYLKRNHVSELFEDMMSKLVQDLPSDPVTFLIRFLQKKIPSDEQKFLSKDKKFHTMTVPPSHDASLWADSKKVTPEKLSSTINVVETDGTADTNRKYSKPWLSNARKDKSLLKEKNRQSLTSKSQEGLKSMDENNNGEDESVDLRLLHAQPKVFGKPQDFTKDKENELICKDENNNETKDVSPSLKNMKPDAYRKIRKQKLKEALADQKMKNILPESSDVDDDDALELFEVMEDLYAEGVKNPPKTGVYTSGNIAHRKEQIEMVLNMSKFFDSLGGAVSVTSRNDKVGGSEVALDNDDFESASQVTGPRRPVWEIPDTEVESVTSQTRLAASRRLDATMFAATNSKSGKKSSSKVSAPIKGDSPSDKPKRPRSQLSNASRKSLEVSKSLSKLSADKSKRKSSSKGSVVSAASGKEVPERPKTAQ